MVIISSSLSRYSMKRLHRSILTDSKVPEAEMSGSSTSEANPTVLHHDICSPGQHSQMAKTSFLICGALGFSFKKQSREI